MKNAVAISVILGLLYSCTSASINRPIWMNKTEVIDSPLKSMRFNSNHKKWKASLLSFVQPIPLGIEYCEDGFMLSRLNNSGIIEGPARIMISSGDQYFYYDIYLENTGFTASFKMDYRSPKTVNTDSILNHQQITHFIDQWRNISLIQFQERYFEEKEIRLPKVSGSYRAQKDNPLSAYYVQPGSCVSIELFADYNEYDQSHKIVTSLLKDKYNNVVADGTLVTFYYTRDNINYQSEAFLLDGYASINLSQTQNPITIYAQIGSIISNKIILNK